MPKERIVGTSVRELWLEGPQPQLIACLHDILCLLSPDGQPVLTCMVIPSAWQAFPLELRPSALSPNRRSTAAELTPGAQRFGNRRHARVPGGSRQRLTYPSADVYNRHAGAPGGLGHGSAWLLDHWALPHIVTFCHVSSCFLTCCYVTANHTLSRLQLHPALSPPCTAARALARPSALMALPAALEQCRRGCLPWGPACGQPLQCRLEVHPRSIPNPSATRCPPLSTLCQHMSARRSDYCK